MCTLEGLLPCYKFWPRVRVPGWGWRSKSGTPEKVWYCFFFYANPFSRQYVRHPYDLGFCVMRGRSVWPIFHGWMILHNIFRTIWWINSNVWIMSQFDATFVLTINVGHSDLHFMAQWFCLISWRLFVIWRPYFRYWNIWHKDWPHKIYVGHWPIFHGPVILLNIFKIIWWINIIFGIMHQCDTKIDLVKYI